MSTYRNNLPQLSDSLFITDGGLETTLIFHQGVDLPLFAAFDQLKNEQGKATLQDYFRKYLELAKQYKAGFILESPTWRANIEWGAKLGYSQADLDRFNRVAIQEMEALRDEYKSSVSDIVISGNIGPRGDGYKPTHIMNAEEAERYHEAQVKVFAQTNADLVTVMTMNYSDEALGVVMAAKKYNMPVVVSFTLETDGRLASGETLESAIKKVDDATGNYASYFMINCAHPNHFIDTIDSTNPVVQRIRGIRANASTKSHAELDESTALDAGDKQLLASRYADLKQMLPLINVIGGCCGTDHSHIAQICKTWLHEQKPATMR